MDLFISKNGQKEWKAALTEWDGNMLLFCLRRINAERTELERLSYKQFYYSYSKHFLWNYIIIVCICLKINETRILPKAFVKSYFWSFIFLNLLPTLWNKLQLDLIKRLMRIRHREWAFVIFWVLQLFQFQIYDRLLEYFALRKAWALSWRCYATYRTCRK